jgi:MFS family permease
MSPARLTACVMLPFAAGYFLSYLFRTINAVIATDLAADLHLGAADLGFLTSIYFLIFAAVQLPFGALLDRHGPKLIQSGLLLLASNVKPVSWHWFALRGRDASPIFAFPGIWRRYQGR